MNDLDSQLRQLDNIIEESPDELSREFVECVSAITHYMKPASIEGLFRALNDRLSHEMAFTILHATETWDSESFCSALLMSIGELWESSPEWTKVIHIRVLNSDETLRVYLKQLRSQDDETRETVRQIFELVANERPHFSSKIFPVLSALNKP